MLACEFCETEHYLYRPSWDSCFYIFEQIRNITSVNLSIGFSNETIINIEMYTEFILF